MSGAGDVNGDGYDDIIIGAPDADPHGKDRAGESYVVFGKSSGFKKQIELSSLDGVNGFQINGIAEYDQSGYSVSGTGDVNGDGYDDIIIGAYGANPHGARGAGESYVVFGKDSDFSAVLELSSLDGDNGFQINGIAEYDSSGQSVSSAGDVNGNGYADVIIGADGAGKISAGESYVVFGVNTTNTTVTSDSIELFNKENYVRQVKNEIPSALLGSARGVSFFQRTERPLARERTSEFQQIESTLPAKDDAVNSSRSVIQMN